MARVAKQRRLRRKARLLRKAIREENLQEREDRRRKEAQGWAEFVEYLKTQNSCFDD